MSRYDVVIAGAGIGGLAAADCLAARGFRVMVLERATTPLETGAGIQLGPNVTRILDRMGLGPAIAATACSPDGISIRDGQTGRHLATVPLGTRAARRYGAPYLVIHRADLHRTLYEAASARPRVDIRHDCELSGFTDTGKGVEIAASGGARFEARVLLGADGLHSQVRQRLLRDGPARPTGHVAWRTLVPMAGLPAPFAANESGLWIAPGGHVVHYPVRAGDMLNLVAIVPGQSPSRSWSQQGDPDALYRVFAHWTPAVVDLLHRAPEWRFWPLYDRPPGRAWGSGRVTLMGDAAHPMLPFLAQGGAMAIEDAWVFAACLAADLKAPEQALARYEDLRSDRAARVQQASRGNARTFHLDGGMRVARNMVLRLADRLAPSRPLARYDWLYGHDAMTGLA
jgi:salicylate hydroxylase